MTSDHVYDRIGRGYSAVRRADPRIAEAALRILALPAGSTIADIGAGTGNYSRALAEGGMKVKAVEPSHVMRSQTQPHKDVELVAGVAEDIPLAAESVDGVTAILSVHHFTSLLRAFREMARVCATGPIVLFTFDPRTIPQPWIADYFPSLWDESYAVFPPLAEVAAHLAEASGRSTDTAVFELPPDLCDTFAASGWCRPEMYLDADFLACSSCFATADPTVVEEGVERLRTDLRSGRWDQRHGELRKRPAADLGYRFVSSRSSTGC